MSVHAELADRSAGGLGPHFGPIRLAAGVTGRQTLALVLAGMASISLQAFMPLMLPYLLASRLHAAVGHQGTILGLLSLVQNLALALVMLPIGGMADRRGRRRFVALALICFSASCVAFSLAAGLAMFVAISVLIGLGVASHNAGTGTSVIDYPANESRGKFLCLMLLTQGFCSAILIGRVALRLPVWLQAAGISPALATLSVYWLAAAIGLAAALLAARAMFIDPTIHGRGRVGTSDSVRMTIAGFRTVLSHAGSRPRFRLVLLVATVMRGDFAIVATFLSLWIIAIGRRHGMAPVDAIVAAGSLFAVLSIMSSITPLLFGWLADRMDRIRLLLASVLASGLAFLLPLVVKDVLGWPGYAMMAIIGATEGAIVVAAQSVLGEEAPADQRASSYALFALLGIAGLVTVNFLGGLLFDRLSPVSPFVLIGLLNLGVFLVALVTMRPAAEATIEG